uniref:Putative Oar protein n=1 Tax=uncultured Acidobacteriota bacterium TaxID=171953 RepID=Q7X324_9BACT|nr:putative Oar protein [uncultured Acidobacteriota bacterium]
MCVLTLVALVATPAQAQSTAVNGSIEGTIRDASGGLLPGVTVTIHNTDTGTRRVVVTETNGLYRATLLPLGAYEVTAELAGFKKLQQTGIAITAGSSAVINMAMEVGGVSEVVSVQADAAVVDLGKIDVGRNLNEREIHNLPLVSRNPYNSRCAARRQRLRELGVRRAAVQRQRVAAAHQLPDGRQHQHPRRTAPACACMSEVAIGEVKVTTSGYAPEFGQTMGLVYNAITPSGTNKMRADASFRFRRTPFSAYPFYSTITPRNAENKPADVVNTWTASAGGPIVRDKLHYYAGFERTYRDMTGVFNLTPELVAQVGQPPQPNTVPAYQTVRFFLGKIDYQLAPSHRLTTRVNWFENNNPFNGGAGNITTIERGFDYTDGMTSTAAQLVSNWGSNRLNELRAQYAERHFNRQSHAGGPTGISVTITNAISFGHPTSDGEDFVQGITQILDNFTLIKGRHSFKQGFDFQYVHDTRAVPLTSVYTFPTVAAYLAAKSGAAPRGYTTFAQVIGDPNFAMGSKLFSAFWQDDWRVAENVKVLYGFRYDAYFYPEADPSAPFSYSQQFKDDTNNFGPRLGVAWTVGARKDQVIRASTGIMYDQPLLAVYENAIQQNGLPARTTYSVNGSGLGAPDFPNTLTDLPAGAVFPAQTIFAPDPNLKLAYNVQNSAQFERGFGRSYHGSVGVVYNRGYNLPVINDINLINPIGTLADGRGIYNTTVNAQTRMDPRFNHINVVQSPGESTYQALLLTFGRRSANGVQYDLNYTLGKGIDTAPLQGAILSVQGDQPRSDPQNLGRDKGPNALDTRHVFNGSIVAMSHFNRGPAVLRAILSDNQVGVILQFNSGLPFTLTGNRDLNGDGNNADRPLNIGRNSYYLPSRYNLDARLSRFIPLGGSRRVEILGEFKNIFNIVQTSAIRNGVNVDAAGNILVPLVFGTTASSLTELPSSSSDFLPTGGYEQRKFQLGFKFAF